MHFISYKNPNFVLGNIKNVKYISFSFLIFAYSI